MLIEERGGFKVFLENKERGERKDKIEKTNITESQIRQPQKHLSRGRRKGRKQKKLKGVIRKLPFIPP
jgi:hypothetical protein